MVVVYGKPVGCFGCKFTKQTMDSLGIEYREVDVTTDTEAYDYITKDLGYAQVPVVVASDGTHWSGLDPDKIKALA